MTSSLPLVLGDVPLSLILSGFGDCSGVVEENHRLLLPVLSASDEANDADALAFEASTLCAAFCQWADATDTDRIFTAAHESASIFRRANALPLRKTAVDIILPLEQK